MSCVVLLMGIMSQENPCELVLEHGNPSEVSSMLAARFAKGWVLDRIIKHLMPTQQFGGITEPRLVIYYFKKRN